MVNLQGLFKGFGTWLKRNFSVRIKELSAYIYIEFVSWEKFQTTFYFCFFYSLPGSGNCWDKQFSSYEFRHITP
jgi:hypothetical protein